LNVSCWTLAFVLTGILSQGQLPGLSQAAPRSALVVGQVIDAGTGTPISGALVEVRMQASLGPPPPVQLTQTPRVLTGSDGRFVFRRLPKGNFMVTAIKPGYLDGAYGRRRPGGDSQALVLFDGQKVGGLRIYLWRHSAITGVVVDEAGEPVVGIQMRAFLRRTSGGQRRFSGVGSIGWTDDRGVYRIHGLLPGDYLVAAVSTKVSVAASTAEDVRRRGTTPSSIAEIGAATAAGRGSSIHVGDALLTLAGSAIGPAPSSDGHVFVYPTTFHPNTASPSRATIVTVASGEERSGIDFQLVPVATRRVSGVIVTNDTVRGGIPVRLMVEDAADAPLEQEVATTVTDRAGAFVFPAVPVGLYSLRVIQGGRLASGLAGTSTIIHTSAGTISSADRASMNVFMDSFSLRWASFPIAVGRDDIANLSIALRPGLNLTGRAEFTGSRERPAPRLGQVFVTIDSLAETSRLAAVAGRFDGSGQFSAFGFAGGRYVIRVGPAPQGWFLQSITYGGRDVLDTPLNIEAADATGVTFTFTDRPTEVIGTVRNSSGNSDPGATVIVFPSDSQTWSSMWINSRRFRSMRVESTGVFKLSPLSAGSYFIVAIPDEVAGDWQDPSFLDALSRTASQFTLVEGESKTLDLRIRELR
jgi:Carboxypeptidase regulatory-like domain